MNEVDETFVDDVLQYVRQSQPSSQGRVKTGLLVSVPGHNAQHDLLQGWKRRRSDSNLGGQNTRKELLVALSPTHASNLQTALKNVIRMAISQEGGLDEYTDFLAEHKAMIPMNFDLELLQKYVQRHGIHRVLVSVSEIETFDTGVLSELISMFSSWTDRIPFVLLIGISTTVELFESRLSRSTVSHLEAEVFEPHHQSNQRVDPLSAIYEAVQYSEETDVFLGPAVVGVLAELADDQSTTAETVTRAISYVFMSHFFANPLSVLSSTSTLTSTADFQISQSPALCQAIRNTSGFKRYCEALAKGDKEQRQKARELLISDETLGAEAMEAIRAGQGRLRSCLAAIRTLKTLSHHLLNLQDYARSPLDTERHLLAALPDLTQTEVFDTVELAFQQMDFAQFRSFFTEAELSSTLEDMKLFDTTHPEEEKQTTFNDIETAIHQADAAFTTISEADLNTLVDAFLTLLRRYLHSRTSEHPPASYLLRDTNPFHDFMSEAFTYNFKSPLASILHARARYSLERALTRPADYLGFISSHDDPEVSDDCDRATLPPTSLLLNMLNEAGHIINVRDLWDAFRDTIEPALDGQKRTKDGASTSRTSKNNKTNTRVEDEEDDDNASGDEDEGEADDGATPTTTTTPSETIERLALALFYRALADLRHLDFVKSSKRKPGVDCIAKTAWMCL